MSSLAAPSGAAPFEPGHVFAARYRLIERIEGGPGEHWRAADLVLQNTVALQLVRPEDSREREATLDRIRLARQLTHPAIRQLHDVGEADGVIYCALELIDGDDLAVLLRRAGRLPPEKVADVGKGLFGALADAHAHGVIHGALTASAIVLDEHGAVRITGFGATRVAVPAGEAPGTPADGSARPAAEHVDIYAAGALLYELLTGSRPEAAARGRGGRPVKPSRVVADVHPRLDRVVLQALQAAPGQSVPASELAASLALASPHRSALARRAWAAGIAIAAVLGVLAVVAARLLPSRAAPAAATATVLLADFRNTTGEAVFDRSLKVALAVALEQSPFLRVFPDERARETLRRMQRQPDEPLTPELAREIAQREALQAIVTGSIATLGSRYVLALEVAGAARGEVVAQERVEVARKEDILTELGAAAARLRGELGESLASIRQFDTPLPQATTSSLEALHAYAMALDDGRSVPREEAIPYLEKAIELDPEFALAHAALSGVYANTGRSAEAPAFSRRAFELRGRVSERERFIIGWRYYVDAAQDWARAYELSRSWTGRYPRDAYAFNSLGMASAAFGQHQEAVQAFRHAIELDAGFVPAHGNLAGSLIALGRYGDARQRLEEAAERGISFLTVRRMSYLLAFIDGDAAAMARELELVRDTADAAWGTLWDARAQAFSGRLDAAHDRFDRAAHQARLAGRDELAAQWIAEDAEAHAVAGDCPQALRELPAALGLSRDNFTLERAARTFAWCGRAADAARLSSELAERYPEATLVARLHRPIIEAATRVRAGHAADAVTTLEPVRAYDSAPSAELWPSYLRGTAYLALGDGRNAAVQFEQVLARRGQAPTSPLYALSYLGAARAAGLAGDVDAARRSYAAFFAAWDGADEDLPVLVAARADSQRLR